MSREQLSPTCVLDDFDSFRSLEAEQSARKQLFTPLSQTRKESDVDFEFERTLLMCAAQENYNDEEHLALLRSLWQSAFRVSEFERTSPQWLSLGFQTEDPIRDLRGVGVLGLRLLHHYCHSSGASVMRATCRSLSTTSDGVGRSLSTDRFPLAAASLNVTLMLCQHLGLLESPSGGTTAVPRCTEATLRAVLKVQRLLPSGGASVLDLIHEQLLTRLHQRWERLEAPSGSCRLMQFPVLLADMAEHLPRALASVTSGAACTLRGLLLALRSDGSGSSLAEELPRGLSSSAGCAASPAAAVFVSSAFWLLLPAVAIVMHTCPPAEA